MPYLRWDKYEKGVKCYWVEDDQEGSWDKVNSKKRTEAVDLHVEVDGADVAADMNNGVSTAMDPRNFPGLMEPNLSCLPSLEPKLFLTRSVIPP